MSDDERGDRTAVDEPVEGVTDEPVEGVADESVEGVTDELATEGAEEVSGFDLSDVRTAEQTGDEEVTTAAPEETPEPRTAGADPDGVEDAPATEEADPLGDLAQRVQDQRRERAEADDDLFEEMETPEVDTDDLWEQVTDAGELTDVGTPSLGDGEAVTVEREDAEGAEPDHIVVAADYCEQCQYFSSPPEVACTYDDSEIVEVVDSERFRVRNCPVVEGETAFETVRGESRSAE